MAYFAQASIDENGKIAGGAAGNQSGEELNCRLPYASSSNPWYAVIAKNSAVLAEMNKQAKYAIANPYIGYDQYQRNTILTQAKKFNWDLSKIDVLCECDCSSLLATVMICSVYIVLGNTAGDIVYNALYAGGNLPATSDFKSKVAKISQYFYIGAASYTPGYGLVRNGHAVIVVNSYVKAGKLPSNSNPSTPSSNLNVDGYWGQNTTFKLQKALGTTQDGIISGQYKADFDAVNRGGLELTTWRIGSGGSNVIRALQKKIGVNADGYFGTNSAKALQRYLGTTADGVVSGPSDMVKALQRKLNAGTF